MNWNLMSVATEWRDVERTISHVHGDLSGEWERPSDPAKRGLSGGFF